MNTRDHQPDATNSLLELALSIKNDWRKGGSPDAVAVLNAHPELLKDRSLVVDLAYEEYCLREEAGATPNADEFCRAFPAFRSHIRDAIHGHRLLADHPEWFSGLAEVIWPNPDETFENLRIVREIGRGAFSRVYLAADPEADRLVVLKLSPIASGEARTIGPLHHPHVTAILWARRVRGFSAICMPFVGTATLKDLIDSAFGSGGTENSGATILQSLERHLNSTLPYQETQETPLLTGRESYGNAVATLMACLADALAFLHRSGIAHGDLKPSNVVLSPGGTPHLIDFNLASGPSQTLGVIGGTLPYMAPERLRAILGGSADQVPRERADIYAFGVVLHELLTGTVPYAPMASDDVTGVASNLLEQATAGNHRRLPKPPVPRPLSRLVQHCLDPRPERRPRSMDQVLRRLRLYRHRRRNAVAVLGTIAILFTVEVSVFVAVRESTRPDPTPILVPVAASRPQTPDELIGRGREFLQSGDVAAALKDFGDAYRLRPDGKTTAYLAHTHSVANSHEAAVAYYRQAIGQNYDAAWVENGLSYSLARLPRSFPEAEEAASRSLHLDEGFKPARLNRAYARFKRYFDTKTKTVLDIGCLEDARAVLTQGPHSPESCHLIATILASSAKDEETLAQAVQALELGIRAGLPTKNLATDYLFKLRLRGRPDFERVIALTPGVRVPGNSFLVDPFAN